MDNSNVDDLTVDALDLADWRRTVAEMYATVRDSGNADRERSWAEFRHARDELFRTHPASPLDREQRAAFSAIDYYQYDSRLNVVGVVDRSVEPAVFEVELPADGTFRYRRVASVNFELDSMALSLSLFWVEGYGGGLFLPFRDGTSGETTYGGGRYLYDTIKGADLGASSNGIVLDFNYAYNPSCAYNHHWVCPLAPQENWLNLPIEAGEKAFDL